MNTIQYSRVPLSVLCLSILLFACTTPGPAVDQVQSRAIDRDYTLPAEVGATTLGAEAAYKALSSESGFVGPNVFFPVIQQSLNDRWTLEWTILPLNVRYQLAKTETQLWGLRAGIHLSYSSATFLLWGPQLGLFHRQKLSEDFALQSTLFGNLSYSSSDEIQEGHLIGLLSGPLYQVNNYFAIHPQVGVLQSKPTVNKSKTTNKADLSQQFWIPLKLTLDWRMTRDWNLESTYQYAGLGLKNLSTHSLQLVLTHYW